MRRISSRVAGRVALSLALGGCIVWAGCGGDSGNETVKPEIDPAVKAKESMDAYKAEKHIGKTGAREKK